MPFEYKIPHFYYIIEHFYISSEKIDKNNKIFYYVIGLLSALDN